MSNAVESRQEAGFLQLELPSELPAGEHVVQSACVFQETIVIGLTSYTAPDSPGVARLLAFRPEDDAWEEVYRAEVEAREYLRNGVIQQLPFELGFGTMAEHDGALYVSLIRLREPFLLRYDGSAVAEHELPGAPFRHLIAWEDGLCGAPVGKLTDSLGRQSAPAQPLYFSSDPAGGGWEAISEPGFGDEDNQLISSLALFDGRLAAAVANPVNGFQLWMGTMTDDGFEWEQWLDQGAMLYSAAPAIGAMSGFSGRLFVGTGLPIGIADPGGRLKPAELIRIESAENWELIAGEPRFSPVGLQVPLSAACGGFDQIGQSRVTGLTPFGGQLYATLAPRGQGPFQLWGTADGLDWRCISDGALGMASADAARVLLATPWGLLAAGAWQSRRPSRAMSGWLGL